MSPGNHSHHSVPVLPGRDEGPRTHLVDARPLDAEVGHPGELPPPRLLAAHDPHLTQYRAHTALVCTYTIEALPLGI